MITFKKITRKALEEFLQEHKQSGEKIGLDLGCGNSYYGRFFPHTIGLDLKQNSAANVQGSALSLPFKANSFDYVLCTEMLEHVPNPDTAIEEIHRILRPNGICLLTTRFLFPIHENGADYFRFTDTSLKHLFKNFKKVVIKPDLNPLETFIALHQRLILQTNYKNIFVNVLYKLYVYSMAIAISVWSKYPPQEYAHFNKHKPYPGTFTAGWYVWAKK